MNEPTDRPPSGTAPEAWPSAWVRAALELAILGSLAGGPLHGYGIAQALADHGFGRLRGGSLYPVLGRLEEAGHITARWAPGDAGPGRKDYELTDAGRAAYRDAVANWRRLGDALADLGATPRLTAQEGTAR